MKKIIIPVVIICLILVAVILAMHFKIINLKELVDLRKGVAAQVKIEPATFCLYNSLPLNNEDVEKILKQMPVKRNSLPSPDSQQISFSKLKQHIELKEPYFLRIGRDGITIDQIDHFLVTENWANGTAYLDFVGKKERANKEDDVYIINIDKDFLKNHRVKSNNLHPFIDADLEVKIPAEAAAYIKTNSKEILFSYPKKEIADLSQEITNNYKLKLYQVGKIPVNDFFIASFQENQEDSLFGTFSLLYVNQKIALFGYFFEYLSFNIDDRWYLGFTNHVVLGSGYIGKELVILENDILKQVVADYSRAD